jgi:hypothetical protein
MSNDVTRGYSELFKLERAVIDAVKFLSQAFETNEVGHLHLVVNVDGRVLGDKRVTFTIGEHSYGDDVTKGNDPSAVLDEYFRRRGFTKAHAATVLTYTGETKVDNSDDISL